MWKISENPRLEEMIGNRHGKRDTTRKGKGKDIVLDWDRDQRGRINLAGEDGRTGGEDRSEGRVEERK